MAGLCSPFSQETILPVAVEPMGSYLHIFLAVCEPEVTYCGADMDHQCPGITSFRFLWSRGLLSCKLLQEVWAGGLPHSSGTVKAF